MKYKYPLTYVQKIKCIIYTIVITFLLIGVSISSECNRKYFQFYGYLFLILIFVIRYFVLKRKIEEGIYISVNAAKCFKMFKFLIECLALVVFIGIIIVKDREMWEEWLLVWQFCLILTVYFIAVFYPFVVVFTEKSYISGSFEIYYREIRELKYIKTHDIMGMEIIKCEIITTNGEKCMEKFTSDEYAFLQNICMMGDKHD